MMTNGESRKICPEERSGHSAKMTVGFVREDLRNSVPVDAVLCVRVT